MTVMPRAFLAAMAGFAAIAFTTTEALASSLGTRFPDLRQQIQDRVDAIPAEGAIPLEAKERKKLVAALVHLDVDSPTLDTDIVLAIKALTQLKKANSYVDWEQSIYWGVNSNNLQISLRDDVSEIEDNTPYWPHWNIKIDITRYNAVAQYFLGSGTLAGDFVKALKYYRTALKTLRKRDKAAQKELIPAKRNTLKIHFQSVLEPEMPVDFKGGTTTRVSIHGEYHSVSDVLSLDLHMEKDGIVRLVTMNLEDPSVSLMPNIDGTGSLDIAGNPCEWDSYSHGIVLSAWSPGTGLVAGAFNFGFNDLVPTYAFCASGAGVFTVVDLVVTAD